MLNKQLKIKKNKLDYVTCNSYIVNRVLEDLAIDNYENLYNYFKL